MASNRRSAGNVERLCPACGALSRLPGADDGGFLACAQCGWTPRAGLPEVMATRAVSPAQGAASQVPVTGTEHAAPSRMKPGQRAWTHKLEFEPMLDAHERMIVLTLLRRFVTYHARKGRLQRMESYAGLWRRVDAAPMRARAQRGFPPVCWFSAGQAERNPLERP